MVITLIIIMVFAIQEVLFVRLASKQLSYQCAFNRKEAFEGDEIELIEIIHNQKRLPILWMMIDICTSPYLDFGGSWAQSLEHSRRVTSLFTVGALKKVTRRWKLICSKRGVYRIDAVTMSWGGLLTRRIASRAQRCDTEIVVYPATIDLHSLFMPQNLIQGDVSVRRFIVDDPFVFTGVRQYTINDPLNRIHWGATARAGQLMVRQNDFTSEITVFIVLNIQAMEYEYSESVNPPLSEYAIKVAASVAHKAITGGAVCGLATNAVCKNSPPRQAPMGGETALQGINDILAHLECKNRQEFTPFLDEMVLNYSNCEVYIITPYFNDNMAARCRKLRMAGNGVRVLLLDKYADSSDGNHGISVWSAEGLL